MVCQKWCVNGIPGLSVSTPWRVRTEDSRWHATCKEDASYHPPRKGYMVYCTPMAILCKLVTPDTRALTRLVLEHSAGGSVGTFRWRPKKWFMNTYLKILFRKIRLFIFCRRVWAFLGLFLCCRGQLQYLRGLIWPHRRQGRDQMSGLNARLSCRMYGAYCPYANFWKKHVPIKHNLGSRWFWAFLMAISTMSMGSKCTISKRRQKTHNRWSSSLLSALGAHVIIDMAMSIVLPWPIHSQKATTERLWARVPFGAGPFGPGSHLGPVRFGPGSDLGLVSLGPCPVWAGAQFGPGSHFAPGPCLPKV